MYAGFPLFLLAFVVLANGADTAHDNTLTDALQRSDRWMRFAQICVMSGLALAFVALLLGAIVICLGPLRRLALASGPRVASLALLATPVAAVGLLGLLIVYAPLIAVVLLILLFVPGVVAALALPFVPLTLLRGGRRGYGRSADDETGRAADVPVAALVAFIVLLALTVIGAIVRASHLSAVAVGWRFILYGAVVAVPLGVFAGVTRRTARRPPLVAVHEQVMQLALAPLVVAAAGLTMTVAGMALSEARMWDLPLSGQHWRLADLLELAALTGIGGALLLATVRAVATTAAQHSRVR